MFRKRIFLSVLFVVIISMLGACSGKEDETAETDDLKKLTLLLTLNGQNIYKYEFIDFVSYKLGEMTKTTRANKNVAHNLLKDYIIHRLLLQEAQKKGIVVDPNQLKKIIDSFKTLKGQKIVSDLELNTDINIRVLRKHIEERMIADKLLEVVVGNDIKIDDEDLHAYFNEKYKDGSKDKQAHVLHILTYDKNTAEDALKKLKMRKPFKEVAKEMSVAAESVNGGDLGYINKDEQPEVFSEAFKLRAGRTSNIIKSNYGYHIFKVIKYKSIPKPVFEEIRTKLHAELYGIKQQKKVKEYINELYENAEINIVGNIDLYSGK